MNPHQMASLIAALMIVIHRQNAQIEHAKALEEGLAASFRVFGEMAQHFAQLSEAVGTLAGSVDVVEDQVQLHLEAIKAVSRRVDTLDADVAGLYR